ncbi:uncharacterized protein LOC111072383 [Drosophila obscura]|uniref:uncharacterized protein LOC111072383 n=1 Tax=Drosophila obscura TaxID=7282 RepID=UPI001BB1E1DB|nr:uncharacterized protein LOC111072383 [Drosophila obscura]
MDEESMSPVCTWTVEEDVDGTSLMLLTRHGPAASAYLYRSQPSSHKRSQQACHLRGDTGPADYASWMLRASRWCLRHRRPHPQRGGLLWIPADGERRILKILHSLNTDNNDFIIIAGSGHHLFQWLLVHVLQRHF